MTFTTQLEGTVETFDEAAYRESLAALLSSTTTNPVTAASIQITVTAASVIVTATFPVASEETAQEVAINLAGRTPAALSTALGVTVESVVSCSRAPAWLMLDLRDSSSLLPPPSPPAITAMHCHGERREWRLWQQHHTYCIHRYCKCDHLRALVRHHRHALLGLPAV